MSSRPCTQVAIRRPVMPDLPQRWTRALGALLTVLFLAPAAFGAATPGSQLQRVLLTSSLSHPIGATHAGDGSGRLFIVQQLGQIRIWDGTQLLATPFLSIPSVVGPCSASSCGERGLLGLAFDPDYETNGNFFIYYTRASDGDIVLARYHVSTGNPNVADPASGEVLLTIEHSSQSNHNGGQLAFGPDGYLYMGVGDGGGGGDPFENGQNTSTLLAKVLRLDIDGDDFPADPARNYRIPAGNPFVGVAGADEVWAYGLRNPWRFSFDRQTGDLLIGDVGQNIWEEINFQPAGSAGGQNYGWDCREAAHPYTDPDNNNGNCPGVTFVEPVMEFDHSPECSVTGGYVYRGIAASSLLTGNYIFSDYCSGKIWRGIPGTGGTWSFDYNTPLPVTASFGLTSFAEGENGRLYVIYDNGSLYWLAPYTFSDVLPTDGSWPFVEAIFNAGITAGCTTAMPPAFCPAQTVSRAEMAIFLLKGRHGAAYQPPPAHGNVFTDVASTSFAAAWIEQIFAEGITAGCGTNPLRYCPNDSATRGQMAAFLARTFGLPLP